jgi:hypothetical protein
VVGGVELGEADSSDADELGEAEEDEGEGRRGVAGAKAAVFKSQVS